MNINKWIYIILIALFLSSCSSATPSPTIEVTASASPFSTTTEQPILSSATPLPTSIPASPIVQACVTQHPDQQALIANGVLVLDETNYTSSGSKGFLYDLNQRTLSKLSPSSRSVYLESVSPDHKKLIYYNDLGNTVLATLVNFQGAFLNPSMENPSTKTNLAYFSWLNADTIRVADASNMSLLRIYSYDPKTNDYKELHTKWPDVYRGNQLDWLIDTQSIGALSYAGANMIYDPTLTRIVYPKNDENISLTDVKTGKELAAIRLPDWGRIPRWSNDGNNLVLVGNIDEKTFGVKSIKGVMPRASRNEEFFIISKDGGKFRQLTHLTDQSSHISIDEYSWSPDSRTIAFWLNKGNNDASLDGKTSELMLLDVNTGEITDLCIQGIGGRFTREADLIFMNYPQPVWSPDGSQIMITQLDPQDRKKYSVLIVDIASKNAYKVAENLEPVGWMTKEP